MYRIKKVIATDEKLLCFLPSGGGWDTIISEEVEHFDTLLKTSLESAVIYSVYLIESKVIFV